MKNNKMLLWLFLIMAFVMQLTGITVAEEGKMINFIREEKTLDEILAMVKTSGKTGLLYFTADWCGPCKLMQKETFIDDKVRTFVESNFLPFWIDNHNNNGPALNKQYNINAFPTMVFIDNSGKVIDKIIGYLPPDKYMEVLKKSVRKEDTIESLRAGYKANPEDKEAAWKYANKLYNAYDYKNALPVFEYLCTVTLDNPENEIWKFLKLGMCYERTRNKGNAIEYYKKGMETRNDADGDQMAMAFSRLGELYFQDEEYNSAIKYIEMLPEDEKIENSRRKYDAMRSREYLPFAYAYIGQEKKAKRVIEAILAGAYEANNYMLMAEFGQMCVIRNMFIKEAFPWVKKANELSDWENGYPLSAYANLCGMNREYDEALKTWQSILELPIDMMKNIKERDKFRASASIAVIHWKLGNTEEAERLYRQLLKESENNASNLYYLGWACYMYKTNMVKALEWAQRTVELSNGKNDMHLHLYAELLFENEEIQKAIDIGTELCEKSTYFRFRDALERYKAALK